MHTMFYSVVRALLRDELLSTPTYDEGKAKMLIKLLDRADMIEEKFVTNGGGIDYTDRSAKGLGKRTLLQEAANESVRLQQELEYEQEGEKRLRLQQELEAQYVLAQRLCELGADPAASVVNTLHQKDEMPVHLAVWPGNEKMFGMLFSFWLMNDENREQFVAAFSQEQNGDFNGFLHAPKLWCCPQRGDIKRGDPIAKIISEARKGLQRGDPIEKIILKARKETEPRCRCAIM